MFLFFWGLQLSRIRRYFKHRTVAKLITAGLFIAVFLAVAAGIYEFFLHGFKYLATFPYFRNALTLYAFELFFLLTSFLIWLGALISLLFGLFKNSNQSWIVASPRYKFLPAYALSSTVFSSSWILIFVLLPSLLAAARVFNFGFFGYVLALLGSIAITGLMIALAYIAILLAGQGILSVLGRISMPSLSVVLGAVALAVFLLVGSVFLHLNIIILLSTENLKLMSAPLGPVMKTFYWFPTSLAALGVFDAANGALGQALLAVGELLGLLALASFVAVYLNRWFLGLWQKLAEGSAPLAHISEPRKKAFRRISLLLNSRFGVVFYKESVLLFRNARNMFWFLFVMLIWLSYIGFDFSIQSHLQSSHDVVSSLPKIILAVQLMILVYFVSALSLRFVFPSFSSERNTAWIFATSPLSLPKLLWSKFGFFSITFGLFAGLAEAVNVLFLKLDAGAAGLFMGLTLCAVAFICAFALYLGVKFPNFETDDPETLSTSIPGLVLVFGSVAYGGLSAYIYFAFLSGVSHGFVLLFIIASLVASVALAGSGAEVIKKIDFVPSKDY
jgi:hypothetical protein